MGAGIVYTIVCCPAIRPRHAPGIRERAVARMRFGCGVGDSSFLVGGGGGGTGWDERADLRPLGVPTDFFVGRTARDAPRGVCGEDRVADSRSASA